MTEFFTDAAKYPFLQYALLAGLLASVACGIVGSFIVVRRSTYTAGAISHTALGGMGVAYYLQRVAGVEWATPLIGALGAAIVAALIIGMVTLYARQREDTILSALWAIGMAIGISFIAATPGYYEDLMSYLFGNILLVRPADLYLMLALNLVIVGTAGLFYNKFLVVIFHEELARLRGLAVGFYHMLLLLLTSLTIVLMVKVVGVVLVIALLTLPAATAVLFTARLWHTMLLAVALSILFTVGGLAISYGPELPTGATIIELAGAVYLLAIGFKKLLTMLRR